jgi:hypothetical protein
MKKIINYHVPDPLNIGDLFASPIKYFEFPGFETLVSDIRETTSETVETSCSIIGGGGLLSSRFLSNIQAIHNSNQGKKIVWGAGQQLYGSKMNDPAQFDYQPYREHCDLFGIRDDGTDFAWVPCVSCMHPAFDRPRSIHHEIVIFSHKKFQINFPGLPRLTHETTDFDRVLDFLGSGEVVLTSSFHGAYWATLLGRKVIVFPFTSKFYTLRHKPAIYPVRNWTATQFKVTLFKKTLYQRDYPGQKFVCKTQNWRDLLNKSQTYPDSLEECRTQNLWFYQQIMNILT